MSHSQINKSFDEKKIFGQEVKLQINERERKQLRSRLVGISSENDKKPIPAQDSFEEWKRYDEWVKKAWSNPKDIPPPFSEWKAYEERIQRANWSKDCLPDFFRATQRVSETPDPKQEREMIIARGVWSAVVSDIDASNRKESKQCYENVTARLMSLEKISKPNAEILLQDMIRFLQDYPTIDLVFPGKKIKDIQCYHLSNMFELGINKGSTYNSKRKEVEEKLFSHLPNGKSLLENPLSFPRYAGYHVPDRDHHNSSLMEGSYGDSMMRMMRVIAFISLFAPSDTYNYYYNYSQNKSYRLCTFSHFEVLLDQCSDKRLKILIERVKTGCLPKNYIFHNGGPEGYIEVLLPAVDLLNADMIEAYAIKDLEKSLSSDEIKKLKQRNIQVLDLKDKSPYSHLGKNLMEHIEKAESKSFCDLLFQFPSLSRITNRQGLAPIHLVAAVGSKEMVAALIRCGVSPDEKAPTGLTARQIATQYGNHTLFNSFEKKEIKKKDSKQNTDEIKDIFSVFKISQDLINDIKYDVNTLFTCFDKATKNYKKNSEFANKSMQTIKTVINELADGKNPNAQIIILGCIICERNKATERHLQQKIKKFWKPIPHYSVCLNEVLARYPSRDEQLCLEAYDVYYVKRMKKLTY